MAEACTQPQGGTKDRLAELRDQCVAITHECSQILADADRETRVLSDEELQRTAALNAEFEAISKEIAQREQVLANASRIQSQSAGRRTVSETATPVAEAAVQPQAATPRINVLDPRRKYAAGTHSFQSFGEQAMAVFHAALRPSAMDDRLLAFNAPFGSRPMAATSTYQSEGVGADGGFSVAPDFRSEILKIVEAEDSILSRCSRLSTTSNEIAFPMDESAPWGTSSVVRAYWDGEGAQTTESKHAAFKKHRIPVDKLTCLVKVTDELLEDADALGSYLQMKIMEHVEFTASNAVFRGTGVGQPLGFMNSAALISVTKTTSQVADTITGDNVVKMWSRLYARYRANAVWFVNQDVEPQLQFLMKQGKLDTGAADTGWGVPLYVQPGGLANSPYGTLMGRPVIATQLCETLGDAGDIVLIDPTRYYLVQRAPGPRFDTSIHLHFDQNITSFRVTWRLGGAPALTSTISPRDGSTTMSAFVVTAERA